jgi:SAM-dependent methyltransferase
VTTVKQGAIPENPLEAVALAAGVAPTPLLDTIVSLLLARAVLVGVKLGVFEALAEAPLAAPEVASRCGTDPRATEKLLGALAGARYLRNRGGRYALTPMARKWMLAESKASLRDGLLYQFIDMRYIERIEEYVRDGETVRLHEEMSAEDWALYQRGMRSGANLWVPEVSLRTPVPRGARELLDIGGSHGLYSVALCRKYPALRATILDLPEAVEQAAPLLAREGMGDRVRHWAGDARTADLGVAAYDVILIANLVHHFDEATNRELVGRCARALRPGGRLVLADVARPASPGRAGQIGALTDLYFGVTSAGGTWSFAEMARWQRAAGLRPRRAIRLLTAPGGGLQVATKHSD